MNNTVDSFQMRATMRENNDNREVYPSILVCHFPLMDNIVKTALDKMSKVKKPQKIFICQLLLTLIVVQGKATFRNMSRYSSMSEKRFRRWYRRTFDFFKLNCLMLSGVLSTTKEKIAALDASFMTKSGKKTDGSWYVLAWLHRPIRARA